MVEVINVYKEKLPALRLIGKRYTDSDRGTDGGYGNMWSEWFEKGYFSTLEELGALPENGNAYMGCMRCAGEFEYWIGMFFPAKTPVPDGFSYADIPEGYAGICWIYGRESSGELYGSGPHNMCMSKFSEQGWKFADEPWFFERYNSPRFTESDEKGNVILDYGIYLK